MLGNSENDHYSFFWGNTNNAIFVEAPPLLWHPPTLGVLAALHAAPAEPNTWLDWGPVIECIFYCMLHFESQIKCKMYPSRLSLPQNASDLKQQLFGRPTNPTHRPACNSSSKFKGQQQSPERIPSPQSSQPPVESAEVKSSNLPSEQWLEGKPP